MIKQSTLKHFFKLTFGLFLVVWLISSIDASSLIKKVAAANVPFLVCSLLLAILLVGFQGLRQLFLLKNINIAIFPLVKLQFIATFVGNFLPATIGIDAYKAYFLKSYTKSLKDSGKLVVLDRLGGMATITIVGLFIFLIEPFDFTVSSEFQFIKDYYYEVFTTLLMIALLSSIFIFYVLINKWALRQAINVKPFVVTNLAVYFTQLGKFAFLGASVDCNISLEVFGMMLLVVQFAALAPFTIGGLGVIEGSIVGVLVYLGVPVDSAAYIAIGNRITILFSSSIGLYYWIKFKKEVVE